MKHCFKTLFLLMIISTICACFSFFKTTPPPKWEYEKEAIKLQIKADPDLNWYGGTSHTLHICVYQLKDRNVFANLAGYEKELLTLLHYRCELFGKLFDQTVMASKKLFIHPDEYLSLTMDRAEDTQYVAIAAGYKEFSKDRAIRVIEVPLIVEKRGFFWRRRIYKPGPLNIEIIQGKKQILIFRSFNTSYE